MAEFEYSKFSEHVSALAKTLEARRQKYKRQLLLVLIFVTLIWVWFILNGRDALQGLLVGMHEVGQMEATNIVSSWDVAALAFFLCIISVWLIFKPIYRYRGFDKSTGYIPRSYSLKDHVFSQLLRFFGDFSFAPEGGNIETNIQKMTIVPPHEKAFTEDNISGVLNDCTVSVAEGRITQIEGGKRIAIFQGLLLLVDISDVRVKLSKDFSGRTVLIADERKNLGEIEALYKDLKHVPLANENLEEKFEIFASDEAEAKKIVTEGLIKRLVALRQTLEGVTEQHQHWDTKLLYALWAIIDSIPNPLAKAKLPSTRAYDRKHKEDLDMTKADPISSQLYAINNRIQLEFFKDKLLMTVPCKHDLFEPDSIFNPALNEEDGKILFEIMQTLNVVTKNIREAQS